MAVNVARRLFTVDEYDQMIQAGVFHEDDRLELVGGEIVEMTPIGVSHAACVKRLNQILNRDLMGEAIISVQDPIHLDLYSEPEPDVAVLRFRPDFYAGGHPEPEDVLLLIEVAETSLAYDRELKLPRYAAAGIEEVWLVDLAAREIMVYREPTGEGYTAVTHHNPETTLSPLAFPDLTINASSVLGEDGR